MRSMERLVMRGLIVAIPIVLMFMVLAGRVTACEGGEGKMYFNDQMTAEAGNYFSKSFTVDESLKTETYMNGDGLVYILTNAEYEGFKAGENHTSTYSMDHAGPGRVELDKGKYWVVLDNRDGNETLRTSLDIGDPAMDECGGGRSPLPTPGFELGFGVMALMIGMMITFIWQRGKM